MTAETVANEIIPTRGWLLPTLECKRREAYNNERDDNRGYLKTVSRDIDSSQRI